MNLGLHYNTNCFYQKQPILLLLGKGLCAHQNLHSQKSKRQYSLQLWGNQITSQHKGTHPAALQATLHTMFAMFCPPLTHK